ncbi:Protein DEFECTIVE IN MERISTEM SILENCING 3 [Linum grandiflorum]
MYQPNHQAQEVHPLAIMEVDPNGRGIVPWQPTENGGFVQAQSVLLSSKKLQDDLQTMGLKIKQHENNIKLLKNQKNKLDDSILDTQVVLGKYHSSAGMGIGHEERTPNQSEEETIKQILQHESSAAGILWQLRVNQTSSGSYMTLMKDVVGIVATLGRVDDDNLSRMLSLYLGKATMLAVVCKSYEGLKALETYDEEGNINKDSGIHALGASLGKALDGSISVICLEDLRPYCGEFILDDPQRRLDLLKPKLPNGQSPPGFLGFAVNMINVEDINLFYLTSGGHGLRETLFYNIFSRLQVYKTRKDMLLSRSCICDGAISLDGGMIRRPGFFTLGSGEDLNIRFPKPSVSSVLNKYNETEKLLMELRWKKEKLEEGMKREQALLDAARHQFQKKKEEFVKFLAESSSYTPQVSMHQPQQLYQQQQHQYQQQQQHQYQQQHQHPYQQQHQHQQQPLHHQPQQPLHHQPQQPLHHQPQQPLHHQQQQPPPPYHAMMHQNSFTSR